MRGPWLAVTAAAVLVLAGCGTDAWDGSGEAACPLLPRDTVLKVAGGLAAGKPEGGAGGPAESGQLPPRTDRDGVGYLCQWAAADDDANTWGLSVAVDRLDTDGYTSQLAQTKDLGTASGTFTPAQATPGEGFTFRAGSSDDAAGVAMWFCPYRTLRVELLTAADGVSRTDGAAELAARLVPKMGCGQDGG